MDLSVDVLDSELLLMNIYIMVTSVLSSTETLNQSSQRWCAASLHSLTHKLTQKHTNVLEYDTPKLQHGYIFLHLRKRFLWKAKFNM